MKVHLYLQKGVYEELRAHLLPSGNGLEQAAFLFAKFGEDRDVARLEVVEIQKLFARDFDAQTSDYLELKDESRIRLIKKAHMSDTALLEMHSHPMPWPAEFSTYDLNGLRDTVPQMLWRLPKRPYGAIVVAPSGLDCLIWFGDLSKPSCVDALVAGTTILKPTCLSIRQWQ